MAPNESKFPIESRIERTERAQYKKWASCENGEEIVISGVSGVFPDSDNVVQLGEHLFAKKDLVTDDNRRWKPDNPKIPHRMGKLNVINKFDSTFFGISEKQAEVMDPMGRILLEKVYEAIIDSGYNPKQMEGTKTGVFVGASFSAMEATALSNRELWNSHTISGISLCMLAHRISFWLGVHGPSYTVDTACSSSAYALENAYKAIRIGDCEAAIVGGCNLCLQPAVAFLFNELGVTNPEGKCKCFDESGNGYARAESVVAILLQKKKDARRMYARVVHAKANCDGYKEEGIHFPSAKIQTKLLQEFYDECKVAPSDIKFLEAHATGTKAGDPVELKVIESVFLPGRAEPLKIGSIKSNIGHTEPASGLCSIVKAILNYETGTILPNINFNNPRTDVEALQNGKIVVVTEPTPWSGGLTAVNSFGFGGANCHVLLDSNSKIKVDKGLRYDDVSYLVLTSGRTEDAVDSILNDFETRTLDVEYVGLLHKIHEDSIPSHYYRGYTLIRNNKDNIKSINNYSGEIRPTWFVFSGMGSQWATMGKSLMKLEVFAESIRRCHRALIPKNIDLINIITTEDDSTFDNILYSYLGIVAIQIALTDVLSAINIKADGFIGHSLGEICCAYADGCLTLEQTILTTYYRGLALTKTDLIVGSMAAIGLGHKAVSEKIPPEVDIGCHNGHESCTITGPKDVIKNLVNSFQQEGIFAREVNSSNIALHSRYIKNAGKKFLKYMTNIHLDVKLRTKRWISSTFLESEWDMDQVKYLSAGYFTSNMMNTVYFEEALKHIPENAVVIEIAPHGLLQAILKRTLNNSWINIPLTSRNHSDNLEYFLCAVGKIFETGANPYIAKLYPPIEFPVSKGTPMISPLVKWDHHRDWFVCTTGNNKGQRFAQRTATISFNDDENKYFLGHVINGRTVYPAVGYLMLVWETFSSMIEKSYLDVPVVFEDVKFLRMVNIKKEETIEFVITIHKDRKEFEITENENTIVSGKIELLKETDSESSYFSLPDDDTYNSQKGSMTSDDIYKEMKSKGYHHKGLFRGITYYNYEDNKGRIMWEDNFVTFIDSMLQTKVLRQNIPRPPRAPILIHKTVINTKKHFDILNKIEADKKELLVYGYDEADIVQCGGIRIENVEFVEIKKQKDFGKHVDKKIDFVPYFNSQFDDLKQIIGVIACIISENSTSKELQCIELVDSFTNPEDPLISVLLRESFKDVPSYELKIEFLMDGQHPSITNEIKETIAKEIKEFPCDESISIVIASNILKRGEALKNSLQSLKKYGFLLTRESADESFSFDELYLNVCFECIVEKERVLLLHKVVEGNLKPIIIKIVHDSYSWLSDLQKAVNKPNDLILLAQNDSFNGIYGLFRCVREEVRRDGIRCFFILDPTAPEFSLIHPFYASQVSKNLSLNVYKNGAWGLYAALDIEEFDNIPRPHTYVDAVVPGDLTTLNWIEGPINPDTYKPHDDKVLVHVYYASLNFRDVMLATGKLSTGSVLHNHGQREKLAVGMEFVGKTKDGQRWMGFVNEKSIATVVECETYRMWPVPDTWTLEEAATVPLVYATVLYALFMRARMKSGESILIHSGAGGVGIAAITVCLRFNCNIFTTVGTEKKRKVIRKLFPSIPLSHIGNSRDESFEEMIKKETKGKGVDIVLNSLAEEKLQASIRCLGFKGRFLEIGKYDLSINNNLGMKCFLKEISFHGVDLASMYLDKESIEELNSLMINGLNNGIVKPLQRAVFGNNQVEAAFRFMITGEHIGKIIIKIREEEPVLRAKPSIILMDSVPRYLCSTHKSYIICGGLGGFGLELTDWMVRRRARNIILTSRNGLMNGYQARKIKLWKSQGVNIIIGKYNVANENEVEELLKFANSLGPVSAIFNLAAILSDNVLEKQTEESFAAAAAPKVSGTLNLDKLSRTLCPHLEHFVVFSSITSGVGNPEQTNYGFANSATERICENRKADNLPALAIEWGTVADVGMLNNMDSDFMLAGLLLQDVDKYLESLDQFLNQPNPVVRSMLVADKTSIKEKSMLDMICHILGIKDINTFNSNTTLADLGIDSITGLEIRNLFEKGYDIYLPPREIRELTLSKLHEMNNMTKKEMKHVIDTITEDNLSPTDLGFEYLASIMNADISYSTIKDLVVRLPSKLDTYKYTSKNKPPTIFFFPGMDGIPQFVEPLSKNLSVIFLCALYQHQNPHESYDAFAEQYFEYITSTVPATEPFYIIGYSFGGGIAMGVTRLLEKNGRIGRLWLLDISPEVSTTYFWPKFGAEISKGDVNPIEALYPNYATMDNQRQQLAYALFLRIRAAGQYVNESRDKISSDLLETVTTLIRTKNTFAHMATDYGLSKYVKNPVVVHFLKANHFSLLRKKETASIIMEELEQFEISIQKQS